MAERVGFEPTKGSHPCRFSRPVHSTALPPLRRLLLNGMRCLPKPVVKVNTSALNLIMPQKSDGFSVKKSTPDGLQSVVADVSTMLGLH